jgi:hypothetical protein
MNPAAEFQPEENRGCFGLILLALFSLGLILLLNSCSCNYHIKKVQKKCNYKVTTDTIYYRDTIVSKEVRLDTIRYAPLHDTIYIQKDRLKIKYVSLPGDSVFIQGICEADTIYKDRIKYINKTEYKASRPWWHWFLAGMLVAFFIETILIAILKR